MALKNVRSVVGDSLQNTGRVLQEVAAVYCHPNEDRSQSFYKWAGSFGTVLCEAGTVIKPDATQPDNIESDNNLG